MPRRPPYSTFDSNRHCQKTVSLYGRAKERFFIHDVSVSVPAIFRPATVRNIMNTLLTCALHTVVGGRYNMDHVRSRRERHRHYARHCVTDETPCARRHVRNTCTPRQQHDNTVMSRGEMKSESAVIFIKIMTRRKNYNITSK